MEMNGMMETVKRQSYWWWFDSHSNTPAHSQWLHSTLSELDERTKSMLRIIEEDADSFAQRAEMYYKKRPQLISLVEDFYRTHRSLAIQFDHLRHDPSTRRTSPLVRSFSLSTGQSEKPIDLHKSYDACFTKSAYDSEDSLSLPSSTGSPEKPFGGRYADMAYDSEESIDSEVDDPVQELNYQGLDYEGEESSSIEVDHSDLMVEIDRLTEETMNQKKQLMEKERVMEELRRKLYETSNEVTELKEETERLRVENVEMYHMKTKDAEDKETMRMNLLKEKEELIAEKDEDKREVIRQMGVAIDMLKSENLLLKKVIANSAKKWNPFEFQALKGFRKLINCSTKPHSVVVPQ